MNQNTVRPLSEVNRIRSINRNHRIHEREMIRMYLRSYYGRRETWAEYLPRFTSLFRSPELSTILAKTFSLAACCIYLSSILKIHHTTILHAIHEELSRNTISVHPEILRIDSEEEFAKSLRLARKKLRRAESKSKKRLPVDSTPILLKKSRRKTANQLL